MVSTKYLETGNILRCLFVLPLVIFVEVLPKIRAGKIATTPASETKRLRTDLLANYDRLQRPSKNLSQPTIINIHFDVQHIVSLEEKFQILTVKGLLMMKWTDEHLTWNPSSYSGLSTVHFSSDEVWLPDLHSLYNVKAQDIYGEKHSVPVVVSSDGSIKWYPQTIFDVPCSAQYRHYPFDSHNCTILLGAWAHTGDDIIVERMEMPSSSQSPVLKGTEWLLTQVEHENEMQIAGQYTFPRVIVRLFLERASRIYRYICVVPTLISMVSILFGFWLLPNDTSRYLVGCSNIIVLSMLLQYLAATVPSGKVVPLLAQYCATCLSLSAAFVVVTVIVGLLRECSGIPPNGLVRLTHFTLDRYFCIFMFSHISSEDKNFAESGSASTSGSDDQKRRKDWYSIAMLVDRITFWCFVFIFVVLLSVLAAV